MSYERHAEALQSLCRVCGAKVHPRDKLKTYATLKYRIALLDVNNVNTFRDEDDIHPKHLCRKCLRRVHHYTAGRMVYGKEYHCNYAWKRHVEHNCSVCHTSCRPRLPFLKAKGSYKHLFRYKGKFCKVSTSEKMDCLTQPSDAGGEKEGNSESMHGGHGSMKQEVDVNEASCSISNSGERREEMLIKTPGGDIITIKQEPTDEMYTPVESTGAAVETDSSIPHGGFVAVKQEVDDDIFQTIKVAEDSEEGTDSSTLHGDVHVGLISVKYEPEAENTKALKSFKSVGKEEDEEWTPHGRKAELGQSQPKSHRSQRPRCLVNLKCCLHVGRYSTQSAVTGFSSASWDKFLTCADRWKELSGVYAEKAAELWHVHSLAENKELKKDISLRFGYHRECYQRFTNISKLKLAERIHKERLQQQQQGQACTSVQTPCQDREGDHQPAAKRPHQSQVPKLSQKIPCHILERECCLCGSARWYQDRLSGKRRPETLVTCQTLEASNLLTKAAEMTGNRELLLYVQDRDLVTSELLYHSSCYRDARHMLSRPVKADEKSGEVQYQRSYEAFCREVIDGRIIERKEIFRMSTLTESFVEYVRKVEELDASSYAACNLKKKLRNSYPQLQFVHPTRTQRSELVMVKTFKVPDIKHSVRAQERYADESEDVGTDSERTATPQRLGDTYFAAKSLRRECLAVSSSSAWPPSVGDSPINASKDLVPPSLFNFVAWLIGASDEPSEDRVAVTDNYEKRILSLAQDIIYATKSNKLQP